LLSALNGCNLIHDVGYLESGLCSSNESIVLADELIGYAKRILSAYKLTPDDLALDVIDKVGPRGSFLEHEHTLARYRESAWRPRVFSRHSYEAWQAAGAEPITTPLGQRATSVLNAHRAPELSGRQVEAMDSILARRG
jgi:trimethylamine---corrinoid protein Co-methyltransferase